jgi:hypothetical protein
MRVVEKNETIEQSTRAFNRWKRIWDKNAKENASRWQDNEPLRGKGARRQAIVFSFGPSLERNIREVKSNNMHYDYDIICVDKALKSLVEGGIVPDYVMLCDAQVSFEKYGNVDPAVCKRATLISTITANPKWSKHWHENGGKIYFTVNKDGIGTHRRYREFLDYREGKSISIPASSNVGNSAYVITTIHMGYQTVLLAGYDYSFKLDGEYYGKANNAKDTNFKLKKHSFNNHATAIDINYDFVQCSRNMDFSARWLTDFIVAMERDLGITTVNITNAGILGVHGPVRQGKLKEVA